jgi:hypothetical protein
MDLGELHYARELGVLCLVACRDHSLPEAEVLKLSPSFARDELVAWRAKGVSENQRGQVELGISEPEKHLWREYLVAEPLKFAVNGRPGVRWKKEIQCSSVRMILMVLVFQLWLRLKEPCSGA